MATSSRRRPSAQPAANPATPADDLSTTPASDQPAAKASPARKSAKVTPATPAAKATKATKAAKTGDTTKAVKPAKAAAATPKVSKPARPARKKPAAKVAPEATEADVAAAVVDVAVGAAVDVAVEAAVEPLPEPAAELARAVTAAPEAAPKPAARPRQRGRRAATAEQTTEVAAELPVATVTAAADADNGALEAVVVAAEPTARQGADEAAPPAPEAEADVAPAAPPAPPAPAHSSITLVDGIRRRLAWQAGSHCPDTLLQAVSRWQDDRGQLRLNDADGLSELLALAARLGHPLEVSDAVWAHVAAHSDLRQRIDHLEAQYPHGLDAIAQASAEAHHPLRPCQLEAAFFAACVGACVLADEPALQIEAPLALAWTLVQRHFGAAGLTVLAPASAWPQWQAALSAAQTTHFSNAADATTTPAPITWLDADDAQAVASATATDVLLADVRGSNRGVPQHLNTTTWLWAVADAHLLGPQPGQRAQAEALLHTVDRLRQGALADWLEHGDIDALAPLLLQRRFADVAEQWPGWTSATADCTLSAEQAETHQTGLTQIAAQLARWQRSGFLSDTEQLALQRQVLGLLHLSEAASTAALPGLLRAALDAGTTRVIVFSGAGHSLPALAQALQAQGLPVQALPSASSPRQADAAARAFRDAPDAQVLLVADGVPGAEPRIGLNNVRPLVLHLDRPWSSAVLLRRLRRVRAGRAQREVPVLQCLATGSLAAMRAALDPLDLSALDLAESADRTAAPAEVLGSVPRLLRGETLRGWLTDLLACLDDAPAAEAPETATATAPAPASINVSEQG
ncbi:hypothetical protein [Ideonella margarita]|uniref:Helicase C-terminal domain-containing protein n=1 Tax=Ideonella margarita TaxID=2984191 RepID=A0ABU9C9D3_9BURK